MGYTKISLSLGEEDVAYLDEQTAQGRYPSRSAAVQRAVRLLRESALEDAYAQAFAEWNDASDADGWDAAVGDGMA